MQCWHKCVESDDFQSEPSRCFFATLEQEEYKRAPEPPFNLKKNIRQKYDTYPILIRGADYAHHISPHPPDFQTFLTYRLPYQKLQCLCWEHSQTPATAN